MKLSQVLLHQFLSPSFFFSFFQIVDRESDSVIFSMSAGLN